jgi:hypothetical protein
LKTFSTAYYTGTGKAAAAGIERLFPLLLQFGIPVVIVVPSVGSIPVDL